MTYLVTVVVFKVLDYVDMQSCNPVLY